MQKLETNIQKNKTVAGKLEENLLNIITNLVKERDNLKKQNDELTAKNTTLEHENIRLTAKLDEMEKYSQHLRMTCLMKQEPSIAKNMLAAAQGFAVPMIRSPRVSGQFEAVQTIQERSPGNMESVQIEESKDDEDANGNDKEMNADDDVQFIP